MHNAPNLLDQEKIAGKQLIDHDKLHNAERDAVAKACVRLFDKLQDEKSAAVRLLGLAAAFILMARAARVDAKEMFQVVSNLMHDPTTSTGMYPQFGAMLYHVRDDMLSDDFDPRSVS